MPKPPPRRPSRAVSTWLFAASAAILMVFGLPLVALSVRALSSLGEAGVDTGSLLDSLGLSLATTAASMTLVAGLGTPLAYAMARHQFRLKPLLTLLVELPVVLPPVVAGLALLMAFGRRGLLGAPLEAIGIRLPFSAAAVIVAQVFVSAPFYIRAAQASFQAIPRELEEIAQINGADSLTVFWRVTLPLSLRGLEAGLALSWARALGEFGATILFAGNLRGVTQTMPLLVYGALERDLGAALWTGLILIALAAAALAIAHGTAAALESFEPPA